MKTTNYNKRIRLLLLFLLPLWGLGGWSQDYQWQWAKSGGGSAKVTNEQEGILNNSFRAELIWDIVTDEDNNYYFLGTIASGSTHVDGNPVPDYGIGSSGGNIIITSFTCDGVYRWSRVIGGGGGYNRAFNMILDNNGGIYVSVAVNNTGNTNEPQTCFSDDDCLPYIAGGPDAEQEGYKTGFLLKYDTDNGELLWRKNYQGDVNFYNRLLQIFDLQIDSNNILHTIIGLKEGVHLDGALTVELDEDEQYYNYYLVKFDATTGNLVGTPLQLPMEGFLMENNNTFRYDEALNRYYLSGWRTGSSSNPLSFNGVSFLQPGYNSYNFILSFNPNDLDDWWYKQTTQGGQREINDIAIDSNSDIYIGGIVSIPSNTAVFFGDHLIGEHPVTTSYSGHRPYVIKMNPQGEVQWSKIPDGYITPLASTGTYEALGVSVNGNEVALATNGWSTIWGSYSIDRPSGHGNDPYLVRFNKQTGEVTGLNDIYGSSGVHYLTAVTADQDGNYVVGGAMRYSLFTDSPNGVAPLYNTSSSGVYTDFFMARLAATQCGTSVSNEVFHKPQLRLYPNPTHGLVYIEAEENIQSYEVYNVVGQRLIGGNSNVINLQDLSQGTYIIKVKMQGGSVSTHKIVKN